MKASILNTVFRDDSLWRVPITNMYVKAAGLFMQNGRAGAMIAALGTR